MNKKLLVFFISCLSPVLVFGQFNTIKKGNNQFNTFIYEERKENDGDNNLIGDDMEEVEYTENSTYNGNLMHNISHDTINWSLPLENIIVNSNYGIRKDPFSGKRKSHNGLDLKADNSPVFSMLPGRVKKVGYDKRAGIYITIENSVCSFSYCHLSKINVLQDNYVRAGQMVAISGNTGNSTGPHLHITCRWRDNNKLFNPMILINLIRKEGKK